MAEAKNASPFVSVVTPVFNGERYLAECIESVLEQTFTDWEYVVVDNQSVDATPRIVERYARADPRIRLHVSDVFRPVIANWNYALKQTSPQTSYCKIVHADDLLMPRCLERMIDVAQKHPSVAVVGAFRLAGTRVDLDGVVPFGTSVVSGKEICTSRSSLRIAEWKDLASASPICLLGDWTKPRTGAVKAAARKAVATSNVCRRVSNINSKFMANSLLFPCATRRLRR